MVILVKALPHASKTGETVCCAGVTPDGSWRRLYPIHFRRLKSKRFARWQWIEYDWVKPKDDTRPESRRVQEDSIVLGGRLPECERAGFLNHLIVPSTSIAKERGNTLALIRPVDPIFSWKRKTVDEIAQERRAYEEAARQLSFFDKELSALEPCPYAFHFQYKTEDGKAHTATCDDWETAAMFHRGQRTHGVAGTLAHMDKVFNRDYPRKGMVFAMGTHSRRPDQWLLVGVIRLDRVSQLSFAESLR